MGAPTLDNGIKYCSKILKFAKFAKFVMRMILQYVLEFGLMHHRKQNDAALRTQELTES